MEVDDCTRLAHAEVLAAEYGPSAAAFLTRAAASFLHHGIRIRRVLSDNGICYSSRVHAAATRALRIRHGCTPPYRTQNQRLGRTLDSIAPIARPAGRTHALTAYLSHYSTPRRHTALGFTTPAHRLAARQ